MAEDLVKEGLSKKEPLGRITENQKTNEKNQRPQPETIKIKDGTRPGNWTAKT